MDAMREMLAVVGHRASQGSTFAYLILLLALLFGPRLAEKVRLPAMVGLVMAGMIVGEHGLNLLDADDIALSAVGTFGLLYLMFAAGLELDLKLFWQWKRGAMTFAMLSFAIPFCFGLLSARLLGYAWIAAVLMGSNWSSHTLATYPILRQMGLVRSPAVGIVVGATAVTDTSALLVLAGVTSLVSTGHFAVLQLVEIVVGLAALGVWTLVALPKIARWFFAQVGRVAGYRVVFGMTAFLSGAVVAEAASIDGIVGAFFAGLGLNRAIPARSPLMERVQFIGSSLFIPIFLVSVGSMLDARVMADPKTLLVAAAFTVAVLGGKTLAAVIAGRAFHFGWPEIGVMSGLSGTQAAATLATTLVGARLGIIDDLTVNAVLLVVLVSMVVTPAAVTFYGKKVHPPAARETPLGSAVLVPVVAESTQPLLDVAAEIAADDGGIVVAASFAGDTATRDEIKARQGLRDKAEEWLARRGLESLSLFRISPSLTAGALEVVRGEGASLLLAEMRGELELSRGASHIAERSAVPTVLVRGELDAVERIVLVASREHLVRPARIDLELGSELVRRLARGRPVVYVGASAGSDAATFPPKVHVDRIETSDPVRWLETHAKKGDLVVFPGIEIARRAIARLPSLVESACIVAISPIAGTEMKHRDAFVVGRTSTDHDRPGESRSVLAADRRSSPAIDDPTDEPLPTTSW